MMEQFAKAVAMIGGTVGITLLISGFADQAMKRGANETACIITSLIIAVFSISILYLGLIP